MSGTSNPFLALFQATTNENNKSESSLSDILEDIFSFTLKQDHSDSKELLYLEDVGSSQGTTELNLETIQFALFERLFMCNSENLNIVQHSKKNFGNKHACEYRPLNYLHEAFVRLQENKQLKLELKSQIKDLIIQNTATALIQPEIYCGQEIDHQMYGILKNQRQFCTDFFIEAATRVIIEENNGKQVVKSFIESMNKRFMNEVSKMSLITIDYNIFTYFRVFTSNEALADIFVESCAPNRVHIGSDYALTPLGVLFNISVLPKLPSGAYEYFTDPMDQTSNSRAEGVLWSNTDKLTQNIHSLLMSLFKCSQKSKEKTLSWLCDCLKYNSDRGKLWLSEGPPELNPAFYTTVTDGFMLNFCNVMLRLCQPFMGNLRDKKILKVDPTYCAVSNEKTESKGVHMHDLAGETCFVPVASSDELEEERLMAPSYSFITECFFMTHKAIDLSYRVGVDQMIKLNREIGKMERAFNDAVRQAGGNSDVMASLRERMNQEVTKYLSLKCQLSDPVLMKNMFDTISSTTYWLSQVAVHSDFTDSNSYAPLQEISITFPLNNKIPNTLKCIPEFLVENVVSYVIYVRRFTSKTLFEEEGLEKLDPILTFILIYMGSRDRMTNPHLRARLAEGLESLLPFHKDDPPGSNISWANREMLFTQHPHRLEIVRSLMTVFVTIEMTGESVEFAQKFGYRRPMYAIFDYLWDLPEHVNCFRELAEQAEKNMEAVTPPIFLKFANLLINDAIYLLDEALANMKELRDMQHAQESGEWERLNARERSQNIAMMHHTGNLARFDNILGMDTICMLEKLTSKIKIVFTHSTMVDRIAAMLNYFLLNLVGPNQKNFKVKDSKEYSFDPASMVLEICKIYVNLKNSPTFCLSVSQDSRSYSPTLFEQAEDVLVRIGGSALIGELKEVAAKVAEKAKEYQESEEAVSDAPEHFLDPIMSTLMMDPVILPSSRQTVDRSTIARHLLSDQTDPFNRSPLAMDQVIPNKELAEEIRKWVEERQKKK